MCQTCKKFKHFVREVLPKHIDNLSDFLLKKKSAPAFVGAAITIIKMANAQSTLVAVLCGSLVFIWWQWMSEGNFKPYKKWIGIIIMTYIVMFKICPYVQDRVSYPDLRIDAPVKRQDANDLLIDIHNVGQGNLPKSTPRLGIVNLDTKAISWSPSSKPAIIRPGDRVRFKFQNPDPSVEFCVVLAESKTLLNGYALEPFYKYDDHGEKKWASYYKNVGVVDDKSGELLDKIVSDVQTDFYNRNWGKFKWIKDILSQ